MPQAKIRVTVVHVYEIKGEDLATWQDEDGNHVTDPIEIKKLIDLDFENDPFDSEGNYYMNHKESIHTVTVDYG